MFLKRLISSILERQERVIVPINCAAPEHDDEYIQIDAKAENFAE